MTTRHQHPPARSFLMLASIAWLYWGLAVAGILLTREEGRIAAVWLPNAVLLAIMLRAGPGSDKYLLPTGIIANVLANLFVGDPSSRALLFGLANGIELTIACLATRWACGGRPDMTKLGPLARFIVIAVLAVAASATMAGFILAPAGQSFAPSIWTTWLLAKGLGLLTATPSLLILAEQWQGRTRMTRTRAIEWVVLMIGGTLVTATVFWQSRLPFLFVLGPIVLIYAFRLGAVGTAVGTVTIAFIASIATSLETGPIHLVQGDLATKLMVLQAFLVTSFLLGMPVAAALEGRESDRAELWHYRDMSRSMLENMREVVFRTDAKGCWIFLNPAWERLTGYTVDQSLGWPTTKLLRAEDLSEALGTFMRIVSGEIDECLMRQRFTTADGAIRDIEVNVRALRGGTGRFLGTIGNLRDVTEQERSLAALADREAQLALLADNATDAIFRLDLTGKCLYASPSCRDLLGIEPDQLIGGNMLERFHPDDRDRVLETHRQLAAGEIDRTVVTYRTQPFYGSSEWIWLEANCGLVRDDRVAAPSEIIASIRDISDRKALEFALEAARVHAEAARAAKSTFLANMSHEIRTPMTGVIGFTDLLLASTLSDEQRRHAGHIADSGRALMRLLNDILDISKVEAGQMRMVAEPFDLRHALTSSLRLMSPVAEQKGVVMRLTIGHDVPAVLTGDSLRLRQIVLNLLSNAVKFTEVGHVWLEARTATAPDWPQLELLITDTGIGIPADRLDAISKPFQQADDSTARRFGGTGLGLAISEQLIHLMHGSITVTSEVGRGTQFIVRLPLIAGTLTDDAEPRVDTADQIAAPEAAPERRIGARILVAEDHDINQILIRALIERLGHEVDIAIDGAEAVAKVMTAQAAGSPYDLVFMDMQMPLVDGVQATRLIRAREASGALLPIVALTANAFAEDVATCLAAGMNAHLAKPVQLDALQATIARFVPEQRAVPVDAAAPAMIDLPPGLGERYASRRAEAMRTMSRLIREERIEAASIEDIAKVLHQLAGTCGMFGEAAMGEACRSLEVELRTSPSTEHVQHIARFLEEQDSRAA